ncbi:MAG: hypothetical protein JW894_05435 [Bacteroidales bacterium]|nr:hypothetical protein [Bacteroidales bacterium]
MENQTATNKRPTFLTVVCILSFIGLGVAIMNNLFTVAFGSFTSSIEPLLQDAFEEALAEVSAEEPGAVMLVEQIFEAILRIFEVLPIWAAITLVCSAIALAGVIMMWNLNKIGFYLYSGGKVILVFLPIIMIGWNLLSGLMFMGAFIVAAVFITLYALNLKAMN